MRSLPEILTNYDSATTGFSDGKIRDNPGDNTGSGVVAAWGNDLYYAIKAVVKKWSTSGSFSSSAESENNSDFRNALEEMIGYRVDGISDWSSATTYTTLDEKVMRAGIQFVCINTTSNLNLDPLTNPLHWMAVPDFRTLYQQYNHGSLIYAAHQLHDYNNAKYRQYFSLGTHAVGGNAGEVFNAYGVHLDGSAVGSGALSTIIETWYLKTPFAPGSTGSRTLQDARGKVPRGVDATGGQADEIGEVLQDQMQGHYHEWQIDNATSGGQLRPIATQATGSSITYTPGGARATTILADGTNGTPRTGLFTRDKSITVGVPYMVIMVPV